MGLIDEYIEFEKNYKNKYGEDTVIFMQVGSFYEVYSMVENGIVKRVCDCCQIQQSCNKKSNIYMCGVPLDSLDKYTEMLINNNFTVVVIVQILENRKIKRIVNNVYTRSSFVKDTDISNNLLCILIENKKMYFSSIDLSTGKSKIFIQSDLDKIITLIQPKEILVYTDNSLFINKNIKTFIYSLYPVEYTKINYINDYFSKTFNINNLISPIENLKLNKYPIHTICYVLLIKFVEYFMNSVLNYITHPELIYDKIYLSDNTIQQLHLLQVIETINKTSTYMGKRLLRERILNPISNSKTLNDRYNEVEKLINNNKYKEFEEILKNIKDLDKLHRKLYINTIKINDIILLYHSYKQCKQVYIQDYIGNNFITEKIKVNIDSVCDIIEKNVNVDNLTFTNCNDLYLKLQNELKKLTDVANNFSSEIKEQDVFKITNTNKEGYFITSSKNRTTKLKEKIKNITIISLTNTCKITNPEIREISENIVNIENDIKTAENECLQELRNLMIQYRDSLNYLSTYIAVIDVYTCIAKCSIQNFYYKPLINKNVILQGKDVRHLLIEKVNENVKYVANDVEFTKNKRGMLVFGINCAGKSSYLRAIGICLILAQSGFYVPAKEWVYTPFTKIFTKIALQDNLFQGDSTFIAEMKEIKNIIENADKHSLILADELCSGTEPNNAVSLVVSTILKLVEKKSKFIFTTHFHDILKIKRIKECKNVDIYNVNVEILPNGKMIFHRKLEKNTCIKDYGVEIAKYIGLDQSFIQTALDIRNEINNENIKMSRYNSDIVVEECKLCKSKKDLQTHHIIFQHLFNKDNDYTFNKNIAHNLIVLCENCHHQIHDNKLSVSGYIETSNGLEVA